MPRLVGIFVVGIILAVAAAFLVRKAQAQGTVTIDAQCDEATKLCTIPFASLALLIKANQALFAEGSEALRENARLKELLEKASSCRQARWG